MKHCVKYPDDKFLAVRPCLVAICFGNRPAAKLLGTLLYRYNLRVENKDDAENQNAIKAARGERPDQDTTYRIFRKQSQLVEDMCGEMTEKTLHDTAVPMLQLLGYLELEEYMQANCYTVNIDLVQQALNLYTPASEEQPQLEKFLISIMQLEKFLISTDELELFLIDKKNFLSGLEKVLIWNRKFSNCRRGRKTNGQAPLKGKRRTPKNIEEITKKDKEESSSGSATATPPAPVFQSEPGSSDQYVPNLLLEHREAQGRVEHVLNEAEQIRIAAAPEQALRPELAAIGCAAAYSNAPIHSSPVLAPDARPEVVSGHSAPGAAIAAVPGLARRNVPATEVATSRGASSKGKSAHREPKEPAQISLIPEQKPLSPEAEVDQCFRWLDEVRQELTGDPMASYVANGANKKRIADLIKACRDTSNAVIERHVKMAWKAMWNAGTFKDGTSWRTPGRLTINAFCNNYGSYLDLARDEQRKRDVGIGASGMRRWSPPPVVKKSLEELKSEWTKKEARING